MANTKRTFRTLHLLIGASFIGLSVPAIAQQSPVTDSNDETIVVTAQKREESIKDIPFSISAIGEQALVRNRVQNVEDVSRLVPGLETGVGFGRQTTSLTVRGVGPQSFNSPTVVAFVDGFTSGLRQDGTADLFDLERVEVLKGPQATLYGRNAIGGTINYITRKPTSTPEMRVQLIAGNYETYAARFSVSGPIFGDVLTARLSGSVIGHDGYFDSKLTGEKHVDGTSDKSIRLALRLAPGGGFESNLVLSYSKTEDECGDCAVEIKGYDPTRPALLGQGAYDLNNLTRTINHEIYGGFTRPIYTAVWNNAYDFGPVTLTSISGYTDVKTDLSVDLNREPGDIPFGGGVFVGRADSNNTYKVFSQEVRLASNGDKAFNWLIGGYYYHLSNVNGGTIFSNFGNFPSSDVLNKVTNYAAFANADLRLMGRLKVSVGLRYDYERTTLRDRILAVDGRVSSSELLPRASLTYEIDDRNNVYATVSRGYHSGLINQCANFGVLACPPVGSEGVGPEFVWNYEVGFKGEQGRRLSYSLAAYYIDWSKQQVTSTTGLLTYLVNAGKTEIYGVEGEIHAQVTDNLSIDAAANWNHARYKDFNDLSGIPVFFGLPAQRAGGRPLLAPDFTGSFSADYRQPVGSGEWDVTLHGDVRYTGKRSIDTSAVGVAPGYAVSNFSLSYGNSKLRMTAFVTNAFDKTYATYQQLFTGIIPVIHAGPPRTFGVQLDANF